MQSHNRSSLNEMQNGKTVVGSKVKRVKSFIGNCHDMVNISEYDKLIALANEVFGLYCWSHSVTQRNIDYIEYENGKYSVGIVAFVKVELKSGIYHQDVGYGTCGGFDCKGSAISQASQEAVVNGFQEALCSFGGEIAKRLRKFSKLQVDIQNTCKLPIADEHELVPKLSVDVSPNAVRHADDELKLERKRRQKQKQEEFLQQLKQKQSTESQSRNSPSCEDLQTNYNTGTIANKENETDLLDDEELLSTQDMNRMVQSASTQQSRVPLVTSPVNIFPRTRMPWSAGNAVIPNRLSISSGTCQQWEQGRG